LLGGHETATLPRSRGRSGELIGLAIPALLYALTRAGAVLYIQRIINEREPRRRSMTRTINNRHRNQKNRHKLAALAKKAKKERNQLG
jgi:hypothetical protein